jgi:tRNA threonylcarbamoyl adenosine modification protein YeaZ
VSATRTLAISTASPALSLALFEAGRLVAQDHRVIGRGHAEALVPSIAAMLKGGRADAIVVDVGPGSFTGIRIGIAGARALGLAWGAPVHGCTAGALVAARAFALRPDLATVTILLDAGRGQVLHQRIARDFTASEVLTLAPDAVPQATGEAFAGAGALLLATPPALLIHAGEPDAADALLLPPAQRALPPAAHYVRPPDAVLPL